MTIKKVYQRFDETSKNSFGMPIELAQNNETICLFCLERVWFNEWLYFNDNNGESKKASYTHYWFMGDIFPVIHGDECRAIWGSEKDVQYYKEKRIALLKGHIKIPGVEKEKVKIELAYEPDEDQKYHRFVEIGKYYSKEKEKRQIKQTTLFQGADEL